jgi:cobyrinic acid a,c-diamide synthase
LKPISINLEKNDLPRIIVAALRGGSGKTILSIGLIAAWKKLNKSIAPFKKGPDYIDTGWLALAAGRPCYNLDTFLLDTDHILRSFLSHTLGLYDGIDLAGSTSTAELAKLLQAPVLLCVDCTKITRTMAAVISGLTQFDPDVLIKGVVLNRVAGSRHERILRDNIEHYCGIPVLGAIPKLRNQIFPERHMGLVPTQIASEHIDLDAISELIQDLTVIKPEARGQKPEIRKQKTGDRSQITSPEADRPKIGIIKDSAFQFYYPENIDALKEAGAETVFISPLTSQTLPELDALYIGGGFPETHAKELAENESFRKELKALAEDNLPIYAECGGLMYLGKELLLEGKSHPMVGVLPVSFDFYPRPQGHGYTIVTVENENPFYEIGAEIRGHEFHYSRVLHWTGDDKDLVFRMQRGVGITKDKDGICYKNVLATYTHIHSLGTPQWAEALINNAIAYKNKKTTS